MTHEDLTAGEGGLAGVTLLPGVRLAEVGACGLEALLAEPAGALVARAVGYSNASKFAQAFSACMGATPSAWRRVALTSAATAAQELAEAV